MAFFVDDSGNITLIQGDSGKLTVDGLPTDKSYTVYFAIKDYNRLPVGGELSAISNAQSSVDIFIPAELTDLLTVENGAESTDYYYGIKLCYTNTTTNITEEDTMLLGDLSISEQNTITVYPKRVEGV